MIPSSLWIILHHHLIKRWRCHLHKLQQQVDQSSSWIVPSWAQGHILPTDNFPSPGVASISWFCLKSGIHKTSAAGLSEIKPFHCYPSSPLAGALSTAFPKASSKECLLSPVPQSVPCRIWWVVLFHRWWPLMWIWPFLNPKWGTSSNRTAQETKTVTSLIAFQNAIWKSENVEHREPITTCKWVDTAAYAFISFKIPSAIKCMVSTRRLWDEDRFLNMAT